MHRCPDEPAGRAPASTARDSGNSIATRVPWPRLSIDREAPAQSRSGFLHHVHAYTAAGEIRSLFFGGEARTKDQLQCLLFRQAGGLLRRDDSFSTAFCVTTRRSIPLPSSETSIRTLIAQMNRRNAQQWRWGACWRPRAPPASRSRGPGCCGPGGSSGPTTRPQRSCRFRRLPRRSRGGLPSSTGGKRRAQSGAIAERAVCRAACAGASRCSCRSLTDRSTSRAMRVMFSFSLPSPPTAEVSRLRSRTSSPTWFITASSRSASTRSEFSTVGAPGEGDPPGEAKADGWSSAARPLSSGKVDSGLTSAADSCAGETRAFVTSAGF